MSVTVRSLLSRLPLKQLASSHYPNSFTTALPTVIHRPFSCSALKRQEEEETGESKHKLRSQKAADGKRYHIVKEVDAIQSIRYIESDAYREVYGDEPVWQPYRRNFRGQYKPETRKQCIRGGLVSTGSACPICRDDYLVIDYRNLKLLKQLTSELSGEPLPTKNTGLCQQQHKKLTMQLLKAQDYGLIEKHVPFRDYDYKYYKNLAMKKQQGASYEDTSSQDAVEA